MNGIRTITDLGCGDWQFSRLLDWSGLEYLGLDVVPAIVENNRNRFGEANVRFEVFVSPEALPGGDLLLSKEVLQHLPNSTVAEYLKIIRKKYRFALLTNGVVPFSHVNIDIKPGGFRPLRLQNPPFSTSGAVVFTYFPRSEKYIGKNDVFLMLGSL
jgi:SAM-dependent methyltransferase